MKVKFKDNRKLRVADRADILHEADLDVIPAERQLVYLKAGFFVVDYVVWMLNTTVPCVIVYVKAHE